MSGWDDDDTWVLVHCVEMKKEEKDTPWMHLVDVLPKPEDGDGDDEFLFQTIFVLEILLFTNTRLEETTLKKFLIFQVRGISLPIRLLSSVLCILLCLPKFLYFHVFRA